MTLTATLGEIAGFPASAPSPKRPSVRFLKAERRLADALKENALLRVQLRRARNALQMHGIEFKVLERPHRSIESHWYIRAVSGGRCITCKKLRGESKSKVRCTDCNNKKNAAQAIKFASVLASRTLVPCHVCHVVMTVRGICRRCGMRKRWLKDKLDGKRA